jgi:hypothetical protein
MCSLTRMCSLTTKCFSTCSQCVLNMLSHENVFSHYGTENSRTHIGHHISVTYVPCMIYRMCSLTTELRPPGPPFFWTHSSKSSGNNNCRITVVGKGVKGISSRFLCKVSGNINSRITVVVITDPGTAEPRPYRSQYMGE